MLAPSIAPAIGETVHLVLCDFGRNGLAYTEADPMTTETQVVMSLISGEYDNPLQVVAFNVAEGWARDISEDVAHEILDTARAEGLVIPRGTQLFLERLLDEALEPELYS